MAVTLVIFDLGNTLVDYHRGELSDDEKDLVGLHRMYAVLRRRYPRLTLTELYDAFYTPWIKAQAHRSKKSSEYDVGEFLGRAIDVSHLTKQQFRRAMLAFHSLFIETVWIAPGTGDVLAGLAQRGIAFGLLANSPIPGFCHEAALDRVGLLRFFESRLFSYDAGIRKPDARLFEMLMAHARATPSSTVMVGDSERLDLEPARKLGIRAIKFDCRSAEKRPASAGRRKWPTLSSLADLADCLDEDGGGTD